MRWDPECLLPESLQAEFGNYRIGRKPLSSDHNNYG
jgi:hypothetical protein